METMAQTKALFYIADNQNHNGLFLIFSGQFSLVALASLFKVIYAEEEPIQVSKTCFSVTVCFSTSGDKLISQVLAGIRGLVWKMLVNGTFFPHCITKGFQIQRFSPHLSYGLLARRREGESPYKDQGLRRRFCLSNPHKNVGKRLGSGTIDLTCLTFVPMHIHVQSTAGTAGA